MEPTTVCNADEGPIVCDQLIVHVGYVADLTLFEKEPIAGVIVAVTRDALILEIWDSTSHGPNGELITVALDAIRKICIL